MLCADVWGREGVDTIGDGLTCASNSRVSRCGDDAAEARRLLRIARDNGLR